VSDKAQRTIRIKWVRSGIGFTYHQKRIVRSLGLKKLNQEVERPDTPQIRGLVAKVPHLVKIVEAVPRPAWTRLPEYIICPPEPEGVTPAPAETAPSEASALETPADQPATTGPQIARITPIETPSEAPREQPVTSEAPVTAPAVSVPREGGESTLTAAEPTGAETTTEKSGIERHREILRSAQQESETAPAEPVAESPAARGAAQVSESPTSATAEQPSPGEEGSPAGGQP